MKRRVLFAGISLYVALTAMVIACANIAPYPGLSDEVYEAGRVAPSPTSTAASGDGAVAVEDCSGLEDASCASGAGCPTGSTLFVTAENPQAISLDTSTAYWTDLGSGAGNGTVGSQPRTGGSPTTLVMGLTNPVNVANNGAGDVAYTIPGSGTVGLYTSATSTTPGTGLSGLVGVAMDSVNVYWVSTTGGAGVVVQAASIASGAVTTLGTAAGSYNAGQLAVQNGNLYFAAASPTSGSGGAIFTLPTGGGTPVMLQQVSTGTPYGLITDNNNVYWADNQTAPGGVYSTPLIMGGSITTLASGLGDPLNLAVDSTNVYVTAVTGSAVLEIPIGGGTPNTLAAETNPGGIAADNNDMYVYFSSLAGVCRVPK
jgi:hypothetical protein